MGRTVGGGIEPLTMLVVAAGVIVVADAAAGGTAGTAWLTAGDCETAFSTLTGSTGEAAAMALFGRVSSAAGVAWGVGRFGASTAGDFRCSVV